MLHGSTASDAEIPMKKKSAPARKLQLDTATIRPLAADLLGDVHGGRASAPRSNEISCTCPSNQDVG
jgi:hypothetical protein